MEVFIREKNCATCPFANKEKPNFICGDAIANDIGLKTNFSVCKLNYFANEESCPLKSLDQHDAEVKKQVVEELRDWLVEDRYNFNMITIRDLKQKLTELEKTPQGKGEKDE